MHIPKSKVILKKNDHFNLRFFFLKTWLIKYMKLSYISCKPEYKIVFGDALCTLYHKKKTSTWISSFVIIKRFLSYVIKNAFRSILKEKIWHFLSLHLYISKLCYFWYFLKIKFPWKDNNTNCTVFLNVVLHVSLVRLLICEKLKL